MAGDLDDEAAHPHAWKPEWSAESPYCGEMVMRGGGGDVCGLLRDDPIHAECGDGCG